MLNLTKPLSGHNHNNGLVGAWFAIPNNVAPNRMRDVRGTINDLTISGGPAPSLDVPFKGDIKHSLLFAGASTCTIPSTALSKVTGPLTFAVWFKYTGALNYHSIVDTTNRHLSVFIQNSTTLFVAVGGAAGASLALSTTLVAGEWYHLVVTSNGTTNTAYINGVSRGTNTSISTSFSQAMGIGSNPSASGNLFNGRLTGIALWNRCMPAGEVSQYYAQAKKGFNRVLNYIEEPDPSEEIVATTFSMDSGTFTMTGYGLSPDVVVPLASGTFTMTGYDASFTNGFVFALDYGTFTMTGYDADFVFVPSGATNFALDHGTFAMTGYDAVFVYSGITSEDHEEIYLGRHRRGDTIDIPLFPQSLPDACPTVTICNSSGVVVAIQSPRVNDALFNLALYLGELFTDNTYLAIINYTTNNGTYSHRAFVGFDVLGGDAQGAVINVHSASRQRGVAVIRHTEDSRIRLAYKTREDQ